MIEMGTVVTIVLILILTSLSFVYRYFDIFLCISFRYWQSKGVPCDEPEFYYGNTKELGTKIHPSKFIGNLYDKFKLTGAKICGACFYIFPWAIPLDLEVLRNMMKESNNFDDRGLYFNELDDPLSANLFSLNGEKWEKLRQKIIPIFSSGQMKLIFPTIVQVADQLRDCLLELVQQGDQVEMKVVLSQFITDIIAKCVFGIECDSLRDPNAEFWRFGRKLFEEPRHGAIIRRLMDANSCPCKIFRMKKIPDDIAAFFMRKVRETVEYREQNNVIQNDFMDSLIRLKNHTDNDKAITFDELAAQAFVFFQAGSESSSSLLAFCLYELALNTEIQDLCRLIIQQAYNKHIELTYDMMMDLPYLDQIINETLRKYPPTSWMPRKAQNDYHVPNSNIVIAKNMTVLMPVHAIHHDPEYYPDPEKFDPDRFETEEKRKRDPMTWLGFGEGRRKCIGQRFGMMQVRVGLITLLNNFSFTLGSNHDGNISIPINKKIFLLTPENVFLNVIPLNQ